MSRIPCQSTIYCANWGFCGRCMPNRWDLQSSLLETHRLDLLYIGDAHKEAVKAICRSMSTIATTMLQDIHPLRNEE